MNYKDPKELYLKCIAEIREQLKFQKEIFQQLYEMKGVQEFQETVLSVIGKVNQNVRKQIIDRLSKRQALRQSITRIKWEYRGRC